VSPTETLEALERDDEACLSTAETAECQCPDFCERDHDRD
jgi:hypothetical protein